MAHDWYMNVDAVAKSCVGSFSSGKMHAVVARLGVFVLGLVVGALVLFLAMYFTKDSTSEDESVDSYDETSNYTGSRANASLKLVFAVSM